jgi:hypothetical protein
MLADPTTGGRIVRKADEGRRREAIQEIPVHKYERGEYDPEKQHLPDPKAEEVRQRCFPETISVCRE